MDAYTIGLIILALALINKIIELSLTATVVVVVAGVAIAVMGRRNSMSNDRLTIKDVTYWRFGSHYYKHYNGKTIRIVKGEYVNAKMEYERGGVNE